MAARIDPQKARLYPEELPEAIVTTASASGVEVASYSAFDPYTIFLKSLITSQVPGVTLRMDNDSGHATLESPLVSRPARQPVPLDIVSYDSLDLLMVGSAFQTLCAYTLRITKMTLFEKYRYGMSLDDDEKALLQEFEIPKKFIAGMLRITDVPQFKKIVEVAKEVTVVAGGNTRVGRLINVKSGEKAVLLGISVDSTAVGTAYGGPGANNTYLTLNRDVSEIDHIKLDCLAMPSLDQELSCYIPAVNRHEVLIESTSGITNLKVRYRYGLANLTVLEKIRWGIKTTAEERAIADEFNLEDAVRIGVL